MNRYSFLLFFAFMSIKAYSQKPQKMVYSIFKIIETDKSYCTTHVAYKTLMLPSKIPSDLRRKTVRKVEKAHEKKTKAKVNVESLYLNPNDWVVVIEVNYKLCKKNKAKRIYQFKTPNKKEIATLIQKKIHFSHALIEDYYVTHTVLYTGQPYINEEAAFFDSM